MKNIRNYIGTEVTITTDAFDALLALDRNYHDPHVIKAVKFMANIQYRPELGLETYTFPIILNGDAANAVDKLERLWRQKLITAQQYMLLSNTMDFIKS